ncbi:Mannose-1-phosphate guanylyltransferase [Candidatus Arthromitus sp. SFB-mouse-NL]|uniref:mannose-1-phosphate guanylyltransferase n=1 Tax=Candidatus Arthromitus sp. SFB-mouse-NL TaxID=1508644 RepID=UPI00049A705E|nr:Mannose-1-phosphate guanylyltransferase [Candidatus Arthromitus sp. SFB-mouse-NL]
MLCAIIMAGGKGTRFWPLSTEEKPKQFLNLLGDKTMIKMTYDRISRVVPKERIFISTSLKYKDLVLEQLDGILPQNIIVEPESRNTSACVCLSNLYVKKKFNNCNVIVLPSDHLINDEEVFIDAILDANEFLYNNDRSIITFGIRPDRPETGYGYINSDFNSFSKINKVNSFVEKPDYDTALKYLDAGNYYWNSGIFIWNVNLILDLIDKFLNNTYKVLSPILYLNQDECNAFVNDNYSLTDNVSIDYSVMEKYNNIFVIEGNFGWDDVGSWSSIDRYSKKDVDGNVLNSAGVLMKSNNNTILTKKKILLNNVNDLIIVETDDYIVVSSKKHAQDIRFAQDYM